MRLMATDLDGTLLGPGGTLSARNIAALQAAKDAGWYVVLATGRPPFMVAELMPQLGTAATHGVMANGSVVATLPHMELLRTIRFEIDLAIQHNHGQRANGARRPQRNTTRIDAGKPADFDPLFYHGAKQQPQQKRL